MKETSGLEKEKAGLGSKLGLEKVAQELGLAREACPGGSVTPSNCVYLYVSEPFPWESLRAVSTQGDGHRLGSRYPGGACVPQVCAVSGLSLAPAERLPDAQHGGCREGLETLSPSTFLITTKISAPHRHHWLIRRLLISSDAHTHLHSARSLGQGPI